MVHSMGNSFPVELNVDRYLSGGLPIRQAFSQHVSNNGRPATVHELHALANADNAPIVRPARNELGKFSRAQNSHENFQTVDNARTRAREVCAGIYDIHLAAFRSGNRTKTKKSPEQFVIGSRSINVVSAKCKYDNLWTRLQHLLPLDLRRRLMLSA